MTPKVPARVIHTSIRVPVTAEEYASIKRAAKLRGAPSLASWLRERGASFGLADGLEALAVREEALDALRRLLETREAWEKVSHTPDVEAYVRARDAYWAARAAAEVAK